MCRRKAHYGKFEVITKWKAARARVHLRCCGAPRILRRSLGSRLPRWVKLRNTQTEHSSSGFPPTTDIYPVPAMVQRPPTQGDRDIGKQPPWAQR
jgi:hypothetical protein